MPAVYVSSSRSLAVLEILAHYSVLPRDFVVTEIRIPDKLIEDLPFEVLPKGWQNPETQALTQITGHTWLRDNAVLRVPSVIIPEESNYVINPRHHNFRKIRFEPSVPFVFDPRLK